MALTQDDRLLRISGAPFTGDNVILTAVSGHEAMSRLYSFQLELVSSELNLTAADLIGKPIQIEIDKQDGGG